MTKIYCKTLGKWCNSMKDAALVAGVNKTHFAIVMRTKGCFKSKEGLEFSFKDDTGNTMKATRRGRSIKCIETGKEFDSISALVRHLGGSYVWIHKKLQEDGCYRRNGFTYTFSDMSPNELPKPRNNGTPIICLETKEKFANIEILRKKLGMGHGTINKQLARYGKYMKNGNTYVYEHAIQNIDEIANLSTYKSEKVTKPKGKKAISITCVQTGEVFKSAKFVAARTKYSTGYISQCLKKYGQFKFDGYTYVYTHSISPKTTSDGTVIICKETGDRFTSLDLFCKYVMANKETVSNIFKNNGKYVMKDGKVFVLEKVRNITPEQKVAEEVIEQKVNSDIKEHTEKKVEKMPVVKMIEKMHEVREKAYNEQEALNQALVSFINKGMYSEASILCDSLQKIYLKK